MKVKTRDEAWREVNRIFPTDYTRDEERSKIAGYSIYFSTAEGVNAWISDLGDRLEVNFADGHSENIWIEPEEQGEDVKVCCITKTLETRSYNTYAEFRKVFRFFWSSGLADEYEDGTEKYFERVIQALRLVNRDEASLVSHINGLTIVFTFNKFK